jgi:hypothetical protein
MPTNYPGSLDSFLPHPLPTDPRNNPSLAGKVTNLEDAMEAVQETVGIIGSADPTSLEYRVDALENAPAAVSNYPSTIFLQAGAFSNTPREMATSVSALSSGDTIVSGFIAAQSMTVANATIYLSTAHASAGSAYIALYSIDASGNGTRIAVTASTTSLFVAPLGKKTVAFTTPVALVAGEAYAVGLFYTTGTNPQVRAVPGIQTDIGHGIRCPFSSGRFTGTAAPPSASFTYAGVTPTSGSVPYVEFTP